ncbi:MAG: hypothetical protein GQ571_01640, partial [Desulfobacterales bacterium]|nr:hypothetical protein [Desulfobacterales bacterium]
MDFTWYTLGVLTGAAGIFLWRLSKQYRLNWLLWGGLTVGIFLILFSIAWSVGAVLEGVPRAASMGLLLFGLSGIVLLTFTYKYIDAKLGKIAFEEVAHKPADEKIIPEIAPKSIVKDGPVAKDIMGKGVRYLAYTSLAIAFVAGMISGDKDYEAMVKAKFQDQTLTKVNDDPVVFQIGEKSKGPGNYVLIQTGQGYGGP